jgi:hypothetical protein
MKHLVTRELLDLYDEYYGDPGQLDDPRTSTKEDRERFSKEQWSTLGEYVDKLYFTKVECLSADLRSRTDARIAELEAAIDPEVITILRGLIMPDCFPGSMRPAQGIEVLLEHSHGPIWTALDDWKARGPDKRLRLRPVAARVAGTKAELHLSVIPFRYRNSTLSRFLICCGLLRSPWPAAAS